MAQRTQRLRQVDQDPHRAYSPEQSPPRGISTTRHSSRLEKSNRSSIRSSPSHARRYRPHARPSSSLSGQTSPVYRLLHSPTRLDRQRIPEGVQVDYPRNYSDYDESSERERPLSSKMELEHEHQRHPQPSPAYEQHNHHLGPLDPLPMGEPRRDLQAPDNFDYNMRRHSIATLGADPNAQLHHHSHMAQPRSPFHPSLALPGGELKRKDSHPTFAFGAPPPIEEYNGNYRQPLEMEPPQPKRRGSAFDQRSIAQMTLNDQRRESVDSGRYTGNPIPGWWDRRDSTTSVYSNASVSSIGGYTSAGSYSGDSKGTWPPPQHTPQQSRPPPSFDPSPSSATRPYPVPDSRLGVPSISHAAAAVGYPDRRMSVPDASMAAAAAASRYRSRSRPPSDRGVGSSQSITPPLTHYQDHPTEAAAAMLQMHQPMHHLQSMPNPALMAVKENTPYSRSPELRVSHKLAERKRRREMKDLFDELRDCLPAERGMKASKWEILSKSIEHINATRIQNIELSQEVDRLRAEVDALRSGQPVPPSSAAQTTPPQLGQLTASPNGAMGQSQGFVQTPITQTSYQTYQTTPTQYANVAPSA